MRNLILFIILTSFSVMTHSATLNKVQMPDFITINNQKLILNGVGTRKATWIKVKVYVGGLYLTKKSSKPQEILNSAHPKHIRMEFVRDLSKEKLIEGWNKAFKSAVKNLTSIQTRLDQFNSLMSDISKKEIISLTFNQKGVEVNLPKNQKAFIEGADFSKALLSIWFINAADEELRDGLLGLD